MSFEKTTTLLAPPNLRAYQRDALAASKGRFDAGINRQLIALPTGTGKTVIFANLLQHPGIEKKMLVLVHRQELAQQALERLRQYNGGVSIGLEIGKDESDWERLWCEVR